MNRRKTLNTLSSMKSPGRLQNRNRYSLMPNRMTNENLNFLHGGGIGRQSINIYKPSKSSLPLSDYSNPRYINEVFFFFFFFLKKTNK